MGVTKLRKSEAGVVYDGFEEPLNASDVENDSNVDGDTVADALNWLLANAGGVPSDAPTLFVLPGSSPTDPDGSLGRPFATVQAAYDYAISEALSGNIVIAIFSGDAGGLTIADLPGGTNVQICGLAAPVVGDQGTNAAARIQTLFVEASAMLSPSTITLANLRIENFVAGAITGVLNVVVSGVRVLGWEGFTVANVTFDNVTFNTSTLQTGVAFFRSSCHWEGPVQVNPAAQQLTFDVASARDCFKQCFIAPTPDTPTAIVVYGDGSPTAIMQDANETLPALLGAQLLVPQGMLGAARSVTCTGAMGSVTAFVIDVYTQVAGADVTIVDDDSAATLLVVPAESAPLRVRVLGRGTDATTALVSVEPLT